MDQLRRARAVPVIRHSDPEVARRACLLLIEAGVSALEITTTVPDAATLIADLRRDHPEIYVGAGTVFTADEAHAVIDAGAAFVVSPCWSAPAAKVVIDAGLPYLPGAMTPGEVLHHRQAGASIVKVFPADAAGGPGFVKALKSVFPDVALMPTGGITPHTAQDYLDAGALCVGFGGNLLPATALVAGDTDLARQQISAALSALFYTSD